MKKLEPGDSQPVERPTARIRATGCSGAPTGQARIRTARRLNAYEKLAEFVRWTQDHPANEWVFRGQSNKEWRLQPSVGRGNSYTLDTERLLLDQFRRLAEPYVTSSELTEWDWLALAQHHGLPTRLLDWTSNSLVACFFACAKARSHGREADGQVIAIETGSVGFYGSKEQSKWDPFQIDSAKLIMPRALAGRILNQRGLFSIHAHPDRYWGVQDKDINIDRFDIPAEMKELLLRGLHNIGIDEAHVMPDLDGLARMLNWQYRTGILPG